jgi:hypothetical protein
MTMMGLITLPSSASSRAVLISSQRIALRDLFDRQQPSFMRLDQSRKKGRSNGVADISSSFDID